MKRIKEVHINNFKFFPETEPIKIDGKNILLYGENGSGKSSFYWALYTLLESSQKSDVAEIQKYFNKLNPQSLVNIHATADATGVDNSFIKIILNDETDFEVRHQNTAINANEQAKESLLASDFLNYRLLQKTHSVKHTEEIDLFSLFEDAVLPYLQFTDTKWHNDAGEIVLKNASDIYKIVNKGPQKIYKNSKGKDAYPQKSKHKSAYNEILNLAKNFDQGLEKLIIDLNRIVYPILRDKLKYDIDFELELVKVRKVKLTTSNYLQPKYSIKLIIKNYFGQGSIPKPQSFLNEAKLSSIALAIRLGILELRFQNASLKILVLDDLMISLDMSNRDKIVRLFLDEYAWFYDATEAIEANRDKGHQTFILTHDRSLFTFIKNDISNLPANKKDTWKLIEMYADDIDDSDPNSFEKPKVFYEQNDLAIAVKHYKQHDYPAAANYIRKYSEEIFCKWLPEYCWKDKESSEKSNNKMPFQNILDNSINVFWPRFGAVPPLYLELKKYLRILLNPLSHADVGVERYKGEIKRVIQVVEAIEKLHKENTIEVIVAGGEEIQIRQTNAAGDLFKGIYELSDSLYKLTDQAGAIKYSIFTGKIIGWEKVDAAAVVTNGTLNNKQKKTLQENHTDFMTLYTLTGSANWMDDLYKMDRTKLI